MISAATFFKNFKKAYESKPLRNGIHKWSIWTKDNLEILKALGEKMGYRVSVEKPVRFDMSWFSPKYFEPQVVIEYETNEKSILESEVLNLACSSAKLKVLVTYAKEGTQAELLHSIEAEWARRSKRIRNDELLVMFIVYGTEKGWRIFSYYDAYKIYQFEGKQKSKELGQVVVYV
jgi:hypothetical protein